MNFTKLKKILIIISLLLVTGCSAEYTLVIDDNTLKETTTLYPNNDNENEQMNNYRIYNAAFFSNPGNVETGDFVEGVEYYKRSVKDYGNYKSLVYDYSFNINNYNDAANPLMCYGEVFVTRRQNTVLLSTQRINNCFNIYPALTNLTINIKVDKEVAHHNADKVVGNTYTWNVDRNNFQNKAIQIEYNTNITSIQSSIPEEEEKEKNMTTIIIVTVVLGLFGIAIVILLKTKGKKL